MNPITINQAVEVLERYIEGRMLTVEHSLRRFLMTLDAKVLIDNIDDVKKLAEYVEANGGFESIYLGAKVDEPTERADGNPVQEGDVYYNTDDEVLKIYLDDEWKTISGGSGDGSGDGVDKFKDLKDTPDSYSDKANYILRVNSDEDGIEFVEGGENSGIDADMVDGKHASDFASSDHTHKLEDLTDVDTSDRSDGYILKWDEDKSKYVHVEPTNGDGASKFTDLDDTPDSYDDKGNYLLRVNSDENAIEFVQGGSGSGIDADKLDGKEADDFAEKDHNHNLSDLLDVDASDKADGKILQWDEDSGKHIYVDKDSSDDSSSTFKDLDDTPDSYTDKAHYLVRVNQDEDGLEFTQGGSGSGVDADTIDGLDSNQFLRSDEDTTATGDIKIDDDSKGLILKSPNGTHYRLKVDDDGNLSTEEV